MLTFKPFKQHILGLKVLNAFNELDDHLDPYCEEPQEGEQNWMSDEEFETEREAFLVRNNV